MTGRPTGPKKKASHTMANKNLAAYATSQNPRTPKPATTLAREDMVTNNTGGGVFEIDDMSMLRRFLVTGSDSNFYQAGAKLTEMSADLIKRLCESNHIGLVDAIVDVSVRGGAIKQSPTLFALAIACSTDDAEKNAYALAQINRVCRTATMLFEFIGYVQQFRGWGKALRKAVAGWYTAKTANQAAYQMVKYRNREGWTHADVLRKSHALTDDPALAGVFNWATKGTGLDGVSLPNIVTGFEAAQQPGADHVALVREHGLTWEMLPDKARQDPKVWAEMVPTMGITALIRQLPTLTRLGLLPAMGGLTNIVAARLTDAELLRKGRVHPITVLNAQRTYASGRSLRGNATWNPTRKIVDALDAAFYLAYGAVEPSGKKTMLCLDISGSMSMGGVSDMALSPREISAAMALVQMSIEPETMVVGFSDERSIGSNAGHNRYYSYYDRKVDPADHLMGGLIDLKISPRQRLDDVIAQVSGLPFGATDPSLPVRWAMKSRTPVETFVVYTDNEVNRGVHTFQVLNQYRKVMGIDAKMVVVATSLSKFSIADPRDKGSLDIAGFDAATPQLIADFSKGLI